ncbi:hypothetical protein DXG01_004415 [Tephrocybe rancida]|nr:hypothetical protein DXG01_004415 [Tephrocybe rancida]
MREAKGDVCRYTQSEVYVSRKWEFFGDYMMGCANPDKKCGYEISLEKPYSMPGLRTRHYVSCDSNAKKQDLQVTEVPVNTQEARQEKIAKLIERLEKQKDAKVPYILDFIVEFMDLRPWTWPIDANGIRVTPSELQGYRAHLFHLPSCLCAIQTTKGQIPRHTASKVYLSEKWEFLGEYMLGCASQDEKCGYEVSAVLVDIEKLAPTQIEDMQQKLNRLDARLNPGVSSTEFSQLFVTCSECDQFMARRVFKHHRCTTINREAIPAGYLVEEDE